MGSQLPLVLPKSLLLFYIVSYVMYQTLVMLLLVSFCEQNNPSSSTFKWRNLGFLWTLHTFSSASQLYG